MKLTALLGAATAAFLMASAAHASTVVSLEPEGGDLTNHAFVIANQTIVLDVHVIVTGATAGAGEDGVQQLVGNFRSSTGGLLGNLAPDGDAVGTGTGFGVNSFNGSGSQIGSLQDADGDLDIDMGKTTGGTGTDWGARNANGQVTNTSGNVADVVVGKISFMVGATANPGDLTHVSYVITGGLINVRTDGVTGNITSASGFTETDAVLEVAGSSVPEPASLGVLALGGLALLARRRK